MKSILFLIYKYWSYNKSRLAKVLLSVIILTAMLTVSIQLEQTECRRKYDRFLHRCNAANLMYSDVSEEIFKEISDEPEVVKAGRIVVCGKMSCDGFSYTYGAYADDTAGELDCLEVICGGFPDEPGEITLYDRAADDLFKREDYEDIIGREISFEVSDLDGNRTEEKIFKVAGIVKFYEDREYSELSKGWEMLTDLPTPSVFLYYGDCPKEGTRNYTLIELTDSEIITEDAAKMRFGFTEKLYERYGLVNLSGSDGLTEAAEAVMSYEAGNDLYARLYSTDTTTLIKYFSFISVIISAISMLGILYSVMRPRASSLRLIRRAGYSRLRLAGLIITEAALLYVLGFVSGIITGALLYEAVLLVQKVFFGLLPLRAYDMELPVRLVTGNPYAKALVCSLAAFTAAYLIYFVRGLLTGRLTGCRMMFRKGQRRGGKFLSGRVGNLISGIPFANVMQTAAFSLILFTATAFYTFYTLNGKGDSYFTKPELTGEAYYDYAGINMKEDGVDCCIYNDYNLSSVGPMVSNNYGADKTAVSEISGMDEVDSIKAYNHNNAANIIYPKDDRSVPALLRNRFKFPFVKEMDDYFDAHETDYYQLSMVGMNDGAAGAFEKYITEGETGKHGNGIILVFCGSESITPPYKVGDEIPMEFIKAGGNQVDIEARNKFSVVVDAIAVIPETAADSDPLTYKMFNDEKGMMMAVTEKFDGETYKNSYDKVYIGLKPGFDSDKFAKKVDRDFIKASMNVEIQTIGDCNRAFRQSMTERYLSIISLIVLLAAMSLTGYLSLVAMIMQNSRGNISVLRAAGMPKKRITLTFVANNVKRTVISCMTGAAAVFLAKGVLADKYNEAAALYEKNGLSMFAGVNVEENTRITELEKKFLLDYELHSVPVIPAMAVISIFLIAVTVIGVLLISKKECGFNISDELSEGIRERE